MEQREKITLRILDESGEERLRQALMELARNLNKESIGDILYSLLNELISNAVKANLKRAFFEKNGFRFDDPESYNRGVEAFKKKYTKIYKDKDYYAQLEKLDLIITVQIDLDQDRLLIRVENNSILMADEERRVRANLAGAMHSENLMEFGIHYGDDLEGEGLGLAMVVQMIKHLGFNPDYFRVFSKDNRTVARLEIPLNKDYTPIRERDRPALRPLDR